MTDWMIDFRERLYNRARVKGINPEQARWVAGEAVRLLSQIAGGDSVYVRSGEGPTERADRDEAIWEAHQAGAKPGELAKQYELSRAQVYRILAAKKADKQPQNPPVNTNANAPQAEN